VSYEWIKDKIKSLAFYAIFFLFIFGFYITANQYDFDLWARLIAGMGFVQTGHVLKQDFLSYSQVHTWFDHEWGSGVIFYLTQHHFGAFGILMLQVVLLFALFFILTKVVKLIGTTTTSPYNFLFYYFAFIAMSYLMAAPIRCQLFSFLFFTLYLYIFELARKGENRPLLAIPFLMIIWNNLHGGCVSGIGLLVLYIVGEFFNKKPVKKYILTLIPTVLVLLINPWGFSYIAFLIKATTMPRPYVVEWWGLFANGNVDQYLKFKFFALILIIAEIIAIIKFIRAKKFSFDVTKYLVLGVTLIMAILHMKMIPFAVIAFTCFLYDDFYTIFNLITRNFFNKIAVVKDSIIYFLILIFAVSNINSKAFEPILKPGYYPLRAIEFIKINDIKGNLLVNFGLGSYASYKLYPHNKIYMDGRYEEVYYDYEMDLFKKFFMVDQGWDEILKRFPPDVIIVEKFYPVYAALDHHKGWKRVFDSEGFGLFVRSKDAKDAKDYKKSYKIPSTDLNYYKKTLFDTEVKF